MRCRFQRPARFVSGAFSRPPSGARHACQKCPQKQTKARVCGKVPRVGSCCVLLLAAGGAMLVGGGWRLAASGSGAVRRMSPARRTVTAMTACCMRNKASGEWTGSHA